METVKEECLLKSSQTGSSLIRNTLKVTRPFVYDCDVDSLKGSREEKRRGRAVTSRPSFQTKDTAAVVRITA